jgi:ribosomal protein S18 acetylase RimI-like enzyme
MNGDVLIRDATVADRAAIGRLWQELMAFHRDYDVRFCHMKPDALDVWLQHLDECMADDGHVILVADAEGELVGFAMSRPGEDPPIFDFPEHLFVTNFAVTPRWRRRGVGQRLFEATAERARRHGFGDIRLSVAADNPVSNAFWRELGFRPYQVNMRRPTDMAEAEPPEEV